MLAIVGIGNRVNFCVVAKVVSRVRSWAIPMFLLPTRRRRVLILQPTSAPLSSVLRYIGQDRNRVQVAHHNISAK